MGVLDGDGYRRRGKGSFWGEFGASRCNQWGFCCVVMRERRTLPKLLSGGLVTPPVVADAWVYTLISGVCDFVCLCIRILKGKRLELSTVAEVDTDVAHMAAAIAVLKNKIKRSKVKVTRSRKSSRSHIIRQLGCCHGRMVMREVCCCCCCRR